MRLLLALTLTACAARAPDPTPTPPRPHVVSFDEASRAVSCAKTMTSLPLDSLWQIDPSSGEQTMVLYRQSCRAVLVVHAGLLADRGSDFDAGAVLAKMRVENAAANAWPFSDDQLSVAREEALAKKSATLAAERAVAHYALDELASLTCSFFVFGQKECLSDDALALFGTMTRAPRALHLPPAKSTVEAPVRYMGPSNHGIVHSPGR